MFIKTRKDPGTTPKRNEQIEQMTSNNDNIFDSLLMMQSLRTYCSGATTKNLSFAMMLLMLTRSSSLAYVHEVDVATGRRGLDDGISGAELYVDFYESRSASARDNAQTLSQLFVDCKEGHADLVCRNRTAEIAYEGVELSELGFNKSYTQAQIEAISWLRGNEVMALSDIIVSRVSPTVHENFEDEDGRALQPSGCHGVLSATCENYGNSDICKTYIKHYPPNGGTPTDGWDEYTQQVYRLNHLQLHRVWAKCESTNLSRKKELTCSLTTGLFRSGRSSNRNRKCG